MLPPRASEFRSAHNQAALFQGAIAPSDQAYVDIFLQGRGIDHAYVALHTFQEQDLDGSTMEYVCTNFHELQYKGDICWQMRRACRGQTAQEPSKCSLTNGKLKVTTYYKGKAWFGGEARKVRRQVFDVEQIIHAAAMAYQVRAADEELDLDIRSVGPDSLISYEIGFVGIQEVISDLEYDDRIEVETVEEDRSQRTGIIASAATQGRDSNIRQVPETSSGTLSTSKQSRQVDDNDVRQDPELVFFPSRDSF